MSSKPTKPTIVIVPGAWVTPAFYTQLLGNLSQPKPFHISQPARTSHEVSMTTSQPSEALWNDSLTLERTSWLSRTRTAGLLPPGLFKALGNQFARVKESRGVVMIVYMTAFVVNKGQSLIDVCGGELLPWIKCDGNYITLAFENPFHDLPQEQQSHWTSVLTHTSLPVFSGNATHEPWRIIPTAYIIGKEDGMLPLSVQEYMVGVLGTSRVYRLGSSHFPFLGMPERVAEIVEILIGEA